MFYSKGAFRLDAKQREAKVGDLRGWSITSLAKVANLREFSRVVANLRDWSLHWLILTTYILNVFNEQKALCTLLLKRYYSNHRFCFVIARWNYR